jgi:hypothetical protein
VIDLASGMVYPGVRAIKQRLKDAESTCGANSNALARDCEVARPKKRPQLGGQAETVFSLGVSSAGFGNGTIH